MKRALELSKNGMGNTSPNPMVGCVIVKDDHVIGEGWHKFYGAAHAEVNAIEDVYKNQNSPIGATLYVTLEPCSHFGKTPPCTDAIIKEGISKVVVAMEDPNPLVKGSGIEKLRQNGIEVIVGVMEHEAKRLNEVFINFITNKMPFCVMKTGMTLDGKIASCTGASRWITGEEARKKVHKMRQQYSAIMVGIGTVIADNPSLNTRLDEEDTSDPHRIIIDPYARTPVDSKFFSIESKSNTIIVVSEKASSDRKNKLLNLGAEIIEIKMVEDKLDMRNVMEELASRKIDSVLLEGGSTLNAFALDAGIVHKVVMFIAPKILGGVHAITPVGGTGISDPNKALKIKNTSVEIVGEDFCIEGYIEDERNGLCLQD